MGLIPHNLLTLFSYKTQDHLPTDGPTHRVSWACPHQSLIKKNSHRLSSRPSYGVISQLGFPLPKLTKIIQHTVYLLTTRTLGILVPKFQNTVVSTTVILLIQDFSFHYFS